MPLLREACPSFAERWSTIRESSFHLNDDGSRLHYIDAGEFARHLIDLQKSGSTEEFPAVFGVIERLLLEGDDDVVTLAVVGYLEDIQTIAGNNALDPVVFVPFLGPEGRKSWDEVNAFWVKVEGWRRGRRLAGFWKLVAGLAALGSVVAWCAS